MTFRRASSRFSRPGGRFGSGRGTRPARQWMGLNGGITVTAGAASVTSLLAFEAPTVTFGTPLTSDPPEDQTILRIIGHLSIVSTVAHLMWLGLMVTDRTWTPVGTTTIIPDLDRRWLWYMTYDMDTTETFTPGGARASVTGGGAARGFTSPVWTDIDISPKVKLEDGKQLCMVSYIDAGTAPTVTLRDMRVLMQRSGRR